MSCYTGDNKKKVDSLLLIRKKNVFLFRYFKINSYTLCRLKLKKKN